MSDKYLDILEKLKSQLITYIDRYKNELAEYSKYDEKINKLEKVSNNLKSNVALIDNAEFEEVLDFLGKTPIEKEKLLLQIKSIKSFSQYLSRPEFSRQPQIQLSKQILEKIIKEIEIKHFKLYEEKKNKKHSAEFMNRTIPQYEKYLAFVSTSNNEINVSHFSIDEFGGFLKFIKNSDLTEDETLSIVTQLSIEHISYYEKRQKIHDKKKLSQIEEKTKKALEKLDKMVETPKIEVSELSISKENTVIPSEINELIEQVKLIIADKELKILEADLQAINDMISFLPLSLSARTEFYDSFIENNDYWKVISVDVNNYLANASFTSKETYEVVLSILKDIIRRHNVDLDKVEKQEKLSLQLEETKQQLNEKINDISRKLKEIYDLYAIEIEQIANFTSIDKNYLSSILECVKSGEYEDGQITNKFSTKYALFYDSLIKLMKENQSLENISINIEGYIEEFNKEEIESMLDKILATVNEFDKELEKHYKAYIEEEKELEEMFDKQDVVIEGEHLSNYSTTEENTIIFLNNSSTGQSYIEEFLDRILVTKNGEEEKNIASLGNAINNFQQVPLTHLFAKTVKLKNDGDRSQYKPQRLRMGNIRLAYSVLPITQSNAENLEEYFGRKITPVLVIDGILANGINTKSKYRPIQRTLAKEDKSVLGIFELFGEDFEDAADFALAVSIIEKSLEQSKNISSKISQERK